jgi:hypothetical protein
MQQTHEVTTLRGWLAEAASQAAVNNFRPILELKPDDFVLGLDGSLVEFRNIRDSYIKLQRNGGAYGRR